MEKAFFFNSMDGDRKYKAGDIAKYFGALVNNGILPNPSTNLQIVAGDGMSVIVKEGLMWINSGYLYWNDSDLVIPLENADGQLDRIDRIVVRWMNTERNIQAYAVTGTPGSSPTAPAIQRDADYYEMCLADVAVNAGTTQIIQANITDQRLSTVLCGVASATYNQIDTEAFNAQLQSWYETYTTEAQVTFTAWFNMLQDVLDENTEANLLTFINQRVVGPESSAQGGIPKYVDETGKNIGEAVPRQDYALPPNTFATTLTAAGWVSGQQTVTNSSIYSAAAPGEPKVAQNATDDEFMAWVNALIRVVAQSEESITLKACGNVPAINIPIVVEVR